MNYYKAFTHDLRSPLQGGEPVWGGALPFTLPAVAVDDSAQECAAGWNFCRDIPTAMKIAGFWPRGRPVRVFQLSQNGHPIIERKDKCRSATGILTAECSQEEKEQAICQLSATWFGDLAEFMAIRQIAWFRALAKPKHDEQAIIAGLQIALEARGLKWTLKKYESSRDAWAARDASLDARAAWDAWAAWDARAAWAAWDARASRDAWAAWDARDAWAPWAARDAWLARAARDPWAALTVSFSAKRGWVSLREDLLTVGLIDAYANGLDAALPTDKYELAWTMA